MTEPLRCVSDDCILTGWDFSTGAVKCLALDLAGRVVAQVNLPTDLWKGEPENLAISELNLMQLEGQARASVRGIAARLRDAKRLDDWRAGGISATHHTAGRIDHDRVQVRRAICWNDQTLAAYREQGEKRLGGREAVIKLIGGPWADRYSLSHLVKDEDPAYLSPDQWKRTWRILLHGPLAAGYLTGNFDVTSISSAASTGIMDFRRRRWARGMLGALADEKLRALAWKQLPKIVDQYEPIGPLSEDLALEAGIDSKYRPLIFPTSDDQQAGLVGGGAVGPGQVAIILGNSAVVNSSAEKLPKTFDLDVMCLNWGPYLLMRCYTNGATLLNKTAGSTAGWTKQQWDQLEGEARRVLAGCDGVGVMPFLYSEPSLGVTGKKVGVRWFGGEPKAPGIRRRASLEALAYLIALGVEAHEAAGQKVTDISVSGGVSRSDLMCEILATVLGRPLKRLKSEEGPALGAAVTALAALESNLRTKKKLKTPFTVADAAAVLVKYRGEVKPNAEWSEAYNKGFAEFKQRLRKL
jgi:sugar (pentulose or hexulose) kinase